MAEVKTFKYTKTGVEGLVTRKVLVLNEDENRIGGFDLTDATDAEIADVSKRFQNAEVRGFGRRAKDEAKPEYETKLPYQYRAFSKAKIAELN